MCPGSSVAASSASLWPGLFAEHGDSWALWLWVAYSKSRACVAAQTQAVRVRL